MCWPAPRSARWRSAARRWRPTCRSRRPSSSGVRLERLLHRRPHRLRPRLVVRDAHRPSLPTTNSVVSGLIGGVQGGYNYRLSRPAVRRRSRSDLSELPASNHVVAKFATARSDLESVGLFGTVRGRVGYTSGPWLAYATGGFAWAGDGFSIRPPASTSKRSISTSARAGPRALDWNTHSRRTGA